MRGYYDNDDNIAANDEAFSTITDSTSYSVSSYLQLIRLKTSIHALGNKRYINHIEKDNDSFMEINDLFEECIILKKEVFVNV